MFLEVDKALREKNPKLHKRIPKFLIRRLERLIHQDEMNKFIQENENISSIEFAIKGMRDFFGTKMKALHEENIPKTGRYIVVCNHPLGGLDGLGLISVVGKHRKDVKFPVNDLLMQLTPMHEVFIPVNKHGRNSQEAAQQLNDVFASDELVLYFPAGLCSRKQNGVVKDLEWKKTIIAKAKEYQRDIIPAYFEGKNSNRFYNIAYWRKKLGIKANIEMIFLPDEAFRQKGKELIVIFGKSISYQQFDQTKSEKEWAEWLKNEVYNLKNELRK
jgi:putative hemolysin